MKSICSAFTSTTDARYDVFPVKRIGLEVDQYKALNAVRLKTIFVLVENSNPGELAKSFMGDMDLFLPPNTEEDINDADVFMYATPTKHFKVFKSKRFFVKAFDVLYYQRRPTGTPVHKIIQSCTLEVLCKLTD
jgi:hypothetical protein